MPRTSCLERAGHISILITWLQGRLVDFIIFKNHPRALAYFMKHDKSVTLSKKRRLYWQKSLPNIRAEFLKSFPDLPSNWHPLLEDLNNKRDMIAHGHISLYREYIMYQPELWKTHGRLTSKSRLKLKSIRRAVDGKISKQTLFILRFNDNNYQAMIKAIFEFDELLFPALAKEIGLDYEKIR